MLHCIFVFMQAAADIDYKSLYEASELRIISLEQQLQQLQKMIFGSRHERFIPTDANTSQLALDIQSESIATSSVAHAKKISYVRSSVAAEQKLLEHPGRMKLPEHLRREEIIIEPLLDITGGKKDRRRSYRSSGI